MSFRLRLSLALAAFLAGGAVVGGSSADTPLPVLTIAYGTSCGFSVRVSGLTIDTSSAPGVTIPPGGYQVVITTPLPDAQFDPPPSGCMLPSFSLSGPGVSWTSNVIGGRVYGDQTTLTLLPSSTYTAVDANHPQVLRVFSTTATGSSASLLAPGQPTSSSGPAQAETQGSLIGSAVASYQGALHASVAASGKAALLSEGAGVVTLTAGLYDFVARDASRQGGFFVRKGTKKQVTITSDAFEGKKTVRVDLTAGTWTFYSNVGKPTKFVVD
ncbi:MAG TPA: hypothetical protein VG265_01235 [Gaiellaceae bacterium]|jgi:hypothetical protein|nr:hypothetical protein [Gaiellaceae bacterium]